VIGERSLFVVAGARRLSGAPLCERARPASVYFDLVARSAPAPRNGRTVSYRVKLAPALGPRGLSTRAVTLSIGGARSGGWASYQRA
jgi:hypothetical protein